MHYDPMQGHHHYHQINVVINDLRRIKGTVFKLWHGKIKLTLGNNSQSSSILLKWYHANSGICTIFT